MKEKATRIFLLILTIGMIIGLILSSYNKNWHYSFVFSSSIVVLAITFIIIKQKKISKKYVLATAILLWLHIFGELHLYYTYESYDKILHFFTPLIITVMISSYLKNKKIGLILIALIVAGMGGAFEILEFFISKFLDIPMVGVIINTEWRLTGLEDTIYDMICNLLGSFTYLIYYKVKNKKSTWF